MQRRKGTVWGFLAMASLAVSLSACRSQSAPEVFTPPAQHPTVYERHPVHGTILGLSPQTGELTLRHDAILGFMPAMTMNYKVKDARSLQSLHAGEEINAIMLVPDNADSYQIDEIKVIGHASGAALATLPAHTLLPGEHIPDVQLENQDGKRVHLRSYAGKVLLVTFIYTRCPMPTACPMITSHFAHVNSLLAANPAVYAKSHLLSITLDPSYDTPQVLRSYGLAYLGDHPEGFDHWEFARSEPSALKALAGSFGLDYHQENNQIVHTVRTLLIDSNGRFVSAWNGSSWKPQEIADALSAAVSGKAR